MTSSTPAPAAPGKTPGFVEFVALMAFAMSLMALSIDAMLPAFSAMAGDLKVGQVNDMQLVISVLLTGLSIGQLIYGPLSDSTGRKPAMYAGFAVFILGCVLSLVANSFPVMLLGRFLQGLGAAGPRTVAMALIRDQFHGSAMARVMSFVMSFFILVPIIAPAQGQGILLLAGWRAIFGVLMILALATMSWLALRQPETLAREQRLPFTLTKVLHAFGVVIRTRKAMVYTTVSGCILGALFSYLNISQQIFQVQYSVGTRFPLYFALLALAIGLASLLNSALVMRFGMHALASGALRVLMVLSGVFLGLVWHHAGHPPFWLFLTSFLVLFFFIGVLFGNLSAIAMEPLGRVAGTGSAVVGSISTLLAVALSYVVGRAYNGTLTPLAIGFVVLTAAATALTLIVRPDDQPSVGASFS